MSLDEKVAKLLARLEEVEMALGDPDVFSDQKKYKSLSQEHAHLSEVKATDHELKQLKQSIVDNLELKELEEDEAFIAELERDIAANKEALEKKQQALENLLVPPDPYDNNNTILELRAGTGGDEAALFVADCVRMYKLFADQKSWSYEELEASHSDMGGLKDYSMVLSGKGVHRFLQYEAGTHRVQRIPETETQGRVHTSAITVAVLIEPDDEQDIKVDEKDLRIDTYRSSGAGGQHVNTTDSAVRMTHLPTGIVVTCQTERSQIQNRERCMRLLKAKLLEESRLKAHQEQADKRSSQVGSGDRSERIRTYNFPQNRVTDHRINLTRYNLDAVMDGELEEFSSALVGYFHQEKLRS